MVNFQAYLQWKLHWNLNKSKKRVKWLIKNIFGIEIFEQLRCRNKKPNQNDVKFTIVIVYNGCFRRIKSSGPHYVIGVQCEYVYPMSMAL